MATEIKMPQLSDTMHSGKILSWQKDEGDTVERGDILAEVETDKANLEIESFHKGILIKITAPVGTSAGVGEVIAYIGEPGEEIDDKKSSKPKEELPEEDEGEPVHEDIEQPITAERNNTSFAYSERVKASPLARSIAKQRNIDLASIQGSGPGGRIIKKDIESVTLQLHAGTVAPDKSERKAASITPSEPCSGGRSTPLSKMRKSIGRRMQQSVVEAPHFYTTVSIDMRAATKLRKTLKGREGFESLSLNHLVIKAASYALLQEPGVNAAWREGQLHEPDAINIGVVTATKEGLLIPVVRSVDKLNLRDCIFEVNAAVERIRAGRPTSQDLSGGTFTISNMGMFDVENFTAIINPGQGAIMAVSSAKETPIVENGQIAVGLMMKATLSVDHRIIDGVMAANFLKHFKEALEQPALMMGVR